MFNLKMIEEQSIQLDTLLGNCSAIFYVEQTTDSIFICYKGENLNAGGSIVQMYDPETVLPLTYTVWKEKYNKEISEE